MLKICHKLKISIANITNMTAIKIINLIIEAVIEINEVLHNFSHGC